MKINIKWAVLSGALLWVLIFFEVCILMFGFKMDTTSTLYYPIHMVALAILTVIASFVYFKGKKSTAVNGLVLGILFLITGLVLDALITVPLFVKDYSSFFDIEMFGGYLEMIIVTTIVGALKNRFVRTKKKP